MITPRLAEVIAEAIRLGFGVEAVLRDVAVAAKPYGNALTFDDAIEIARRVEDA